MANKKILCVVYVHVHNAVLFGRTGTYARHEMAVFGQEGIPARARFGTSFCAAGNPFPADSKTADRSEFHRDCKAIPDGDDRG